MYCSFFDNRIPNHHGQAHFDYECAYVVVPLESALWLGLGLRAGGRLFQREVGSSNEEWLEIATWG